MARRDHASMAFVAKHLVALTMAFGVPLGCAGSDDPAGGSAGESFDHGVVYVTFRRSDAERSDPFAGTTELSVTLEYGACLRAFYDAHPELAQTHAEGRALFDAWLDGGVSPLCSVETPATLRHGDCNARSIAQTLDERPRLTVTFDGLQELEGRALPIGPIPDAEAAACPAGPRVTTMRLRSAADVIPRDATGASPWFVESFDNDTPIVGATGAIVIVGRRTEGG